MSFKKTYPSWIPIEPLSTRIAATVLKVVILGAGVTDAKLSSYNTKLIAHYSLKKLFLVPIRYLEYQYSNGQQLILLFYELIERVLSIKVFYLFQTIIKR